MARFFNLLLFATTTILMVSGKPSEFNDVSPLSTLVQPNWQICELKYAKEVCQLLKSLAPNSMIPDLTCVASTSAASLTGQDTAGGLSPDIQPLGPVCPPETDTNTAKTQEGPIGTDGPATGPKGTLGARVR